MKDEVISIYTRQQAIKDGVLIDISDTAEAKEAGFRIPVCVTRTVWEDIKVPAGLEGWSNLKGRLWDVCYMAVLAFKEHKKTAKNKDDLRITPFEVYFRTAIDKEKKAKLWLVFNEYEGFTIMYPEDY